MKELYKYDIALSFAEEDRDIALALSLALKQHSFTVYYYSDSIEETWGTELEKRLTEIYKEKARYAIVILSNDYFRKSFAAIEFAAIQQRIRQEADTVYMLPVLAHELTLLEKYEPGKYAYIKWEHNAEDIAEKLKLLFGAGKAAVSAGGVYENYQQIIYSNKVIAAAIKRNAERPSGNFVKVTISAVVLLAVIIFSLIKFTGLGTLYKGNKDTVKPAVTIYDNGKQYTYQMSISKDTTTDIEIEKGDSIIIKVGGMMRVGSLIGNCGPEGLPNNRGVWGISVAGYNYFKQWNHGALLYRFSKTGEWRLYEKNNTNYAADEDGYLDFGINDKKQTDHKGHYTVVVIIKRRS
jgi:hypothetical protein